MKSHTPVVHFMTVILVLGLPNVVKCDTRKGGDAMSDTKIKIGPIKPESQNNYSGKVRGMVPGQACDLSNDQELSVLIKVTKAGYIPPDVTFVTRIDPLLFTARIKGTSTLQRITDDSLVERVEIGVSLPSEGQIVDLDNR